MWISLVKLVDLFLSCSIFVSCYFCFVPFRLQVFIIKDRFHFSITVEFFLLHVYVKLLIKSHVVIRHIWFPRRETKSDDAKGGKNGGGPPLTTVKRNLNGALAYVGYKAKDRLLAFAKVKVNGIEASACLDSGATDMEACNFVTPQMAKYLGMDVRKMPSTTLGVGGGSMTTNEKATVWLQFEKGKKVRSDFWVADIPYALIVGWEDQVKFGLVLNTVKGTVDFEHLDAYGNNTAIAFQWLGIFWCAIEHSPSRFG